MTQRLAVTPTEAARKLGVSRSFFYAEILPELRCIYRGRKRLIPFAELHRWVDRSAVGGGRR